MHLKLFAQLLSCYSWLIYLFVETHVTLCVSSFVWFLLFGLIMIEVYDLMCLAVKENDDGAVVQSGLCKLLQLRAGKKMVVLLYEE